MKVWNYIFIVITMTLFFEFMGLPTALSGLFDFFNISITDRIIEEFSFTLSSFLAYLFTSISALTAIGISIGSFITGRSDIGIKAGFASAVFLSFISSLYFPLTYAISIRVSAWTLGILSIVFIPFTIGFAFALVEYVVGGTTD